MKRVLSFILTLSMLASFLLTVPAFAQGEALVTYADMNMDNWQNPNSWLSSDGSSAGWGWNFPPLSHELVDADRNGGKSYKVSVEPYGEGYTQPYASARLNVADQAFARTTLWTEVSLKFENQFVSVGWDHENGLAPFYVDENGQLRRFGMRGRDSGYFHGALIDSNFKMELGKWYHIVVAMDFVNAPKDDGGPLYVWVNGEKLFNGQDYNSNFKTEANLFRYLRFFVEFPQNETADVYIDNFKFYTTSSLDTHPSDDFQGISLSDKDSSDAVSVSGDEITVSQNIIASELKAGLEFSGNPVLVYNHNTVITDSQTVPDGSKLFVNSSNGVGFKEYTIINPYCDALERKNIFSKKNVQVNLDSVSDAYPSLSLTDDSYNGTESSGVYDSFKTVSNPGKALETVIDLERLYEVDEISIIENTIASASSCADDIKIEAGITENGETKYRTVAFGLELNPASETENTETVIDLNGEIADKIKITFGKTGGDYTMAYDISEIKGYGEEYSGSTFVPEDLTLWYDEPAPDDDMGSTAIGSETYMAHRNGYIGWEEFALPIGNGYMGAMIFGQTEHERVQLTENSLVTPKWGLSNFAETYIDFPHPYSGVTNYYRDLDMKDATASVRYTYNNVEYTREYITSYPDKVMAIKLDASESASLDFTLRPTIPYLSQESGTLRSGTVKAQGDTIILSGTMGDYGVDYEGIYKIVPTGGTITNDESTITVSGADSAVIYIAIGTNYPLGEEWVFDNARRESGAATVKAKMDLLPDPHEKLDAIIVSAVEKGYDAIRQSHINDYKSFFDRVSLTLVSPVVPNMTTDILVESYGSAGYDHYLEKLMYQYGRYLLISSSREGALPANLQGVWNRYFEGICAVGYWHNVNLQMNYWPLFVGNLPEMFVSYADMYETYLPTVEKDSAETIKEVVPENYVEGGYHGWSIGTGIEPFYAYGAGSGGIDGCATGAWTAELFWEYYQYTKDEDVLRDLVYPAIYGAATYMIRLTEPQEDGTYLVEVSGSPENHVDFEPVGAGFTMEATHDIVSYTLEAAQILGIDTESDENLKMMKERVDHLSPVVIGHSGQIKEFREETVYGEFGDYQHRHISHLVGLYPGTTINEKTSAWLDSAQTTLDYRGNKGEGAWAWAMAHRTAAWARTGNGKRAYDVLQCQIGDVTWRNLWAAQVAFQIEGNFGASAAIGEMLLQSHNGYIEPLPAVPAEWSQGNYEGLGARGNFEVSASWKNSRVYNLEILSKSGEECTIKYPMIANAKITASDASQVEISTDGTDFVTFPTKEGVTYTLSAFSDFEITEPATNLTADTSSGNVVLSWGASENAATYNVYQARNDDPAYELVAQGVTGTTYTFPTEWDFYNRYTFAVTAVSADGRESDRVWTFINGLEPVSHAVGYFTTPTTLDIYITPNYKADTYLVYSVDSNGEETLVAQSEYTTAVVENADPEGTYIIKAMLNGEIRYGQAQLEIITDVKNVMLNKPIEQIDTNWPLNPYHPAEKIVDGDYVDMDSRIAVVQQEGKLADTYPLVLKVDLKGSYLLDTMNVIERVGQESGTSSISVRASKDGGNTWYDLVEKTNLKRSRDSEASLASTDVFDVSGNVATHLEFTLSGNLKQDIGGIIKDMPPSLLEIECYGILDPETNPYDNLALSRPAYEISSVGNRVESDELNNAFDGKEETSFTIPSADEYIVEVDFDGMCTLNNFSLKGSNADSLATMDVEVSPDGGFTWSSIAKDSALTQTVEAGDISATNLRVTFKNASGYILQDMLAMGNVVSSTSMIAPKIDILKALSIAENLMAQENINQDISDLISMIKIKLAQVFVKENLSYLDAINAKKLSAAISNISAGNGMTNVFEGAVVSANLESIDSNHGTDKVTDGIYPAVKSDISADTPVSFKAKTYGTKPEFEVTLDKNVKLSAVAVVHSSSYKFSDSVKVEMYEEGAYSSVFEGDVLNLSTDEGQPMISLIVFDTLVSCEKAKITFDSSNGEYLPFEIYEIAGIGTDKDIYAVNITNSHTGETDKKYYVKDEEVTVNAGTVEEYVFNFWDAQGVTLSDSSLSTIKFTMPGNDVNLVSNWREKGYEPALKTYYDFNMDNWDNSNTWIQTNGQSVDNSWDYLPDSETTEAEVWKSGKYNKITLSAYDESVHSKKYASARFEVDEDYYPTDTLWTEFSVKFDGQFTTFGWDHDSGISPFYIGADGYLYRFAVRANEAEPGTGKQIGDYKLELGKWYHFAIAQDMPNAPENDGGPLHIWVNGEKIMSGEDYNSNFKPGVNALKHIRLFAERPESGESSICIDNFKFYTTAALDEHAKKVFDKIVIEDVSSDDDVDVENGIIMVDDYTTVNQLLAGINASANASVVLSGKLLNGGEYVGGATLYVTSDDGIAYKSYSIASPSTMGDNINVLSFATESITASIPTRNETYHSVEKMIDGSLTGDDYYKSNNTQDRENPLVVTINLKGTYLLNSVEIYERYLSYGVCSDSVKIELAVGDEVTTVVENGTLNQGENAKATLTTFEFSEETAADKIIITFKEGKEGRNSDESQYQIYEINAIGRKMPEAPDCTLTPDTVTMLESSLSVKTRNTTGTPVIGTMFVAVYEEGLLKELSAPKVIEIPCGESTITSGQIDTTYTDVEYKIFVWDSLSGIKPLVKTVSVYQ